jgi:hypothetical protein
MLILGKDSKDKGTQLETLTRSILSELNFINIVSNQRRLGGEEIDISAEREFVGMRGVERHKFICECKAYRNPVDMSDWLKFLRKLFTSEKCERQPVYGYFVALNGVNGSVAGHHHDLATHISNVSLVCGEELFNHVSNIYTLCDLKTIKETIHKFTNRQVLSYEEIAYYNNQVFRIVTFESDSYTILRGNGQPITREVFNSLLKDLVELALPVRSFIDLQEEEEAIKKAIRTQKFVISHLFLSAGTIAKNSVFLVNEFTVQEINDAIERLCEQTLLTQSDDFGTLFLDNENTLGLYTALAKIYGFLLEGEITDWVVKALESGYHINHINENFVSEIQRIKGGLVLSPKQVDEVILLLKWSLGALNWSLNSQETLINSSQMDLVNIDTQKEAICFTQTTFLVVFIPFLNMTFVTHYFTHIFIRFMV